MTILDSKGTKRPLSPAQVAMLDAIRTWWRNAGIPPTLRDLMRMCGYASKSTVNYHLDALERAGHIRRTGGRSRSIVLVERDTIPPAIKATLLAALDVDEEENGKSQRIADARRWLCDLAGD